MSADPQDRARHGGRESDDGGSGRPAVHGWRRWVVALLTATLVPALLLGALEGGLRLAGYGHATSFLVPIDGRDGMLTTNPRFGWRFFPPDLAREPVVCELRRAKRDGVVRVFVLGGSAAMGTPESAFGVARILEAMFAESWPDSRFEVVNAAMAAVGSHVVREIAAGCSRHRPDLFVVYLGNNEVVGPYGPGSVFGRFSPGLSYVRAAIWVRGTRLGQLLHHPADWLAGRLGGGDVPPRHWHGMEMFRHREVAADDPRLAAVYDHLRRNLEDVIATADAADAPVVLSTVAVNLADSPPFASRHRPDLTAADLERWQQLVDAGAGHLRAGRPRRAAAEFREALSLDDAHAGLHFRLGRALLALGESAEARRHLMRARDLDALRFRADEGVNRVIRQVAAGAGRTVLVDAAADLVPGEVPGADQFFEHVHLRFAANHRLATLIFDAAAPLLAARLGPPRGVPPSARRCAELLGFTDHDRLRMAETILAMTGRPPFTGQLDHRRRQQARRSEVRALRAATAGGVDAALAAKRRALSLAGERGLDDLPLRTGLAALLETAGRPAEAAAVWRRLVERVPGVAAWRTRLGFALADAGRLDEAVSELRAVLALSPRSADALANLGTVLERRGELDAAETLYRRALDDDPAAEGARLNLARLLERQGRAEAALAELRAARDADPDAPLPWRRLAELHDRRGDLQQAVTGYRAALERDPDAAPVHNNLGHALERLGRAGEAADAYAAATRADPGYALAWFNLADLLLSAGRPADAVPAYRRALALQPDNAQGRANLQLALRWAAETAAAER